MALTETDDRRYEVLDGELVMTPAPIPRHQRCARNLFRLLDAHVERARSGELFFAPIDIVLGLTTVCQPDIVFVRSGRLSIIGEKNIEGPPDLAVEVLSPSTRKRDAVVKRGIYAVAGVAHVWIVDPEERTLEELVLEGDTYRQGAVLDRPEHVFEPAIFPGLAIELKRLWG